MISDLKKKLTYRSTHRGCKEMDLLLSSFVIEYIKDSSTIALKELEEFLDENELEIRQWVLEKKDIPEKYQILINKISNFN